MVVTWGEFATAEPDIAAKSKALRDGRRDRGRGPRLVHPADLAAGASPRQAWMTRMNEAFVRLDGSPLYPRPIPAAFPRRPGGSVGAGWR